MLCTTPRRTDPSTPGPRIVVRHAAVLRSDADIAERPAARLSAAVDAVTRRMLAPPAVPRRGIATRDEHPVAHKRLLRLTGP